ncbi:MAG: DUF4198 domain-containing protein [Rhodobacteraceae bacterium]|nr:DUF4198 domain-containing protein [Paracoccaceae bacterium]
MLAPFIGSALVALSFTQLQAHEFWIDPLDFEVEAGAPVQANLRVGETFKGAAQVYLPHRFRQFETAFDGQVAPVEGRMGDRPPLNVVFQGEGLVSVVHVTTDSTVSYRGLEKFGDFVRHKDAEWTLDAHRDAGLPTETFKEVYSRYAKSLIAVGEGKGDDRTFGLETEIVARDNPYTDDLSAGMSVELYYLGEPRRDAQIEVFEKIGEDVRVFTVRTDADGVAQVPVQSGAIYMLDAVVLRTPVPELAEANDAVWESLWANLTFAVP